METYDREIAEQTLAQASKYHNKEAFNIDRDQEDRDVVKYQRSGDQELFEKIYDARIPTIKWWTRAYHYVIGGHADMEGELRYYFVRAINAYDKKRGHFNTCLYTFFINHIRNMITKRGSHKRTTAQAKSNLENFVLSLDYGWDKKGEDNGNMDGVFASKMVDHKSKNVTEGMTMAETVHILSKGNPFLKEVFEKIGEGHTISSVLQSVKTRNGKISMSAKRLGVLRKKGRCKALVSEIIKNEVKPSSGFSVIGYKICRKKLHYVIELRKTKEADEILRVIRKLRKREKELRRRIGS